MTIPPGAQRARLRYASALYRTALLYNRDPPSAGRAVAIAFKQIDWSTAQLDDYLEARLVAALPAPSSVRLRRRPSQLSLPPLFWKLAPHTRLALGLRLLRGMQTPLIAEALKRPANEVQSILLDGLTRLGDLPNETNPACRRCRAAELDDSQGERAHLLICEACRTLMPRLRETQEVLATQLGREVAQISLPAAADQALNEALDQDDRSPAVARWRHPALFQAAAVIAVIVVLTSLWLSGGREADGGGVSAVQGGARQIIERALQGYGTVPPGEGVVHRRWQISLERPQLVLQADEWVDAQNPAYHRMQLMQDQQVKEWQVGDERQRFHYQNTFPRAVCGPPPVTSLTGQINTWSLSAAELQELHAARWQAGIWAIGRRYLDAALAASSLRSLGVSGRDDEAALTLMAEGATISGTLLLRLDPQTEQLREIRELRTDNGETVTRVPWRLVLTQTVDDATALKQGLLIDHPTEPRPPSQQQVSPIVDRACPLTALARPLSFPRLLAVANPYRIVGLPDLPPSIDRALLLGSWAPEESPDGGYNYNADGAQLIYLGAGKRLVFARDTIFALEGPFQKAGNWNVQIEERVPGMLAASITEFQFPSDARSRGAAVLGVWAEGWSREELLQLLANARPLRMDDWARHPDIFPEPAPFDAQLQERLTTITLANAPQAGQTLHTVETRTLSDPALAQSLTDPYHRPIGSRPLTMKTELWLELDGFGAQRQLQVMRADPDGKLLDAIWNEGVTVYHYDAARGLVVSEPLFPSPVLLPSNSLQILFRHDWTWRVSPGGEIVAELAAPVTSTIYAELLNGHWDAPLRNREMWLHKTMPTTVTQRIALDSTGKLRYRETLGSWQQDDAREQHEIAHMLFGLPESLKRDILRGLEKRPSRVVAGGAVEEVVLQHQVMEHMEWLPVTRQDVFNFVPPAGTRFIPIETGNAPQLTPQSTVPVLSLPDVASRAPFQIWSWSNGRVNTPFRVAYATPAFPAEPDTTTATSIYDAPGLGLAVQLEYASREPQAKLTVIQGPLDPLRQVLRQTPPLWQRSERRKLYNGWRVLDVWVMQSASDKVQWAVIEWGDTLFFLEHLGSEYDFLGILETWYWQRPVQPRSAMLD